jgi:integrase
MASFTIVIKKDKQLKDGKFQIYFRFIHERKVKYLRTGLSIEEPYWDNNKGRVKANYPNSHRINLHLNVLLIELQDNFYKEQQKSNSIDYNKILFLKNTNKKIDFFKYCEPIVQSYKIKGLNKSNTIVTALKHLKRFNKSNSLEIKDFNYSFVRKFEFYLREERKLKGKTIYTLFKLYKLIFKQIVIDKIIPYSSNPFLNYKVKTEKSQRAFLNELEIKKLIELDLSKNSKEEITRDLFIFACYCGGMRVSDILMLRKSNFNGTHINFTSSKTTTQQHLKVPTKALDIIKKYQNKDENKKFLFPLLDENSINDEKMLDNQKRKTINMLNDNLKIIINKASIDKIITFHCSRHTFATRAIAKGIALEKVSKLLGHATVMQTLEYAKIVNNQIDNAMDLFN